MNIADLKPGSYTPIAPAAPAGGALNIKTLPQGSYTAAAPQAPVVPPTRVSPFGGATVPNSFGGNPLAGNIAAAKESIVSTAQAGAAKANEGAADTRAATTVGGKALGLLKFGSGVAGVVGAPIAPVMAPVGGLMKQVGSNIADTPPLKAYGNAVLSVPADQPTGLEKVVQPFADAGDIANMALGAKGLIDRIPEAKPSVPKAPTPVKQSPIVANRVSELTKVENGNATVRKVIAKASDKGIDAKALLAQTDLLHNSVDNTGTIRTQDAMSRLNDFLKPHEDVISRNLNKEGVKLPLTKVHAALVDRINHSGLEGDALESAHGKIDATMKGLERRTDASGNIPLAKIQDAKVSKYATLDYVNPASKIADKAIAKTFKTLVEKNTKSVDVQALNRELTQHYSVMDLLEKLDGKKVDGGKLGKYFAQTLGGIAGAHIGGPLGAIVGSEVAGRMKGASMAQTFKGKGGSGLQTSDAMNVAVAKGKAPPLGLPAPKVGAPKVSNNVPIHLGRPSTVESQAREVGPGLQDRAYASNARQSERTSNTNPSTAAQPTKSSTPSTNTDATTVPSNSIGERVPPKTNSASKPINRGMVRIGRAKIHADDQVDMKDFTDYVNGTNPAIGNEAHQLELSASRIFEKYWPNKQMPKNLAALAKQFGTELDKRGFGRAQDRDTVGKYATKAK